MNNQSPQGILGIIFKNIEFFGTNHFIYNKGPVIRVSCNHLLCQTIVSYALFVGSRFKYWNTWKYELLT